MQPFFRRRRSVSSLCLSGGVRRPSADAATKRWPSVRDQPGAGQVSFVPFATDTSIDEGSMVSTWLSCQLQIEIELQQEDMVDQIRIAFLRSAVEHLILVADIHIEVLVEFFVDP